MLKESFQRLRKGYESLPSPVRTFAWRAFLLFIFWKGLYLFLWQGPRTLDGPLTELVGRQSTRLLGLLRPSDTFSYKEVRSTYILDGILTQGQQTYVMKGDRTIVRIADNCNGLELLVLYLGFILCMPASLGRKLMFGLLGLIVIHFVNVLRCSGLGLMVISMKEYFDFAHHYLFKIVIYATIFLLWVWFSKSLQLSKQ
jgi:exosortase/archaeosortase family protein